MEIIWTRIARITYFEILENLHKNWTSKEIKAFHRLTTENLSQITSGKILHPITDAKSGIRRVVLHPNVSLYYILNEVENTIYLITFFNNRMDPELLKNY
jgi:6-phosphogluconolactonase (cycloisomerase 2 family)